MPPRNWRLRAADIISLAQAIRASTAGMSYEESVARNDCRDANICRVALIGEAANAIPDEVRELRPDIPWRRIRDMRNVLMHVYFGISTQIVWDTIQQSVPQIAADMQSLLDAAPDQE